MLLLDYYSLLRFSFFVILGISKLFALEFWFTFACRPIVRQAKVNANSSANSLKFPCDYVLSILLA
ncbi:MAG: hypothetical protein LBP59_11405 [Planctomycetaceae bacterium]|nr:hypothetical protein [Planctomycetaceae bacterium]